MSQPKIYVPQGFQSAKWQNTKSLRRTLDMARSRLLVICCTFMIAFIIIVVRLVDVSLLRGGGHENYAQRRSLVGTEFRADKQSSGTLVCVVRSGHKTIFTKKITEA